MKTKTILLSLALSVCLVSTIAITVSCEKSGLEDEPMVGEWFVPDIIPSVAPYNGLYTITYDGTTISGDSSGYSFRIMARDLTLDGFHCTLYGSKQSFDIHYSCNLTLDGLSSIRANDQAQIHISDIKLSGDGGCITIIINKDNFTTIKGHISAAEGYTVTVSDVTDEGKGYYSCMWKVDKKVN